MRQDLEFRFFLGGYDLEMVTIRDLLKDLRVHFEDRHLSWGATLSDYSNELKRSFDIGETVVLVELKDDNTNSNELATNRVVWIDHHGPWANRPSSLEQVFQWLELSEDRWTRWFDLVVANDRGHTTGMQRINASLEEMVAVRKADRHAQGITNAQEEAGRIASENARYYKDFALTVVELPHDRTATVTDVLSEDLGGPGYSRLLILAPASTHFYGDGATIELLRTRYPASWYGGELPERGFWGCPGPIPKDEWQTLLFVANSET